MTLDVRGFYVYNMRLDFMGMIYPVFNTEYSFVNFQFDVFSTRQSLQPLGVFPSVRRSLFSIVDSTVERDGKLRAETGRESQSECDRHMSAARQVYRSQFGVCLTVIGHRGNSLGLKGLHGDDLFNTRPHGMPGETFGVGDDDFFREIAEDGPQGFHFRGC